MIPKDVIHHLSKFFPLDVGVLAPIFLNVLRLQPGQGLFVPPNVLHAYIDGDAVESILYVIFLLLESIIIIIFDDGKL